MPARRFTAVAAIEAVAVAALAAILVQSAAAVEPPRRATTAVAESRPSTDTLPLLSFGGFSWLENLVFDGLGNLFMSEASRGQLWRVYATPAGDAYNKTLVLDDFARVDGLAVTGDGSVLYAVAQTTAKQSMVVAVDTNTTAVGDYRVVVNLPKLPNGMKRNTKTGKLYLTVEGAEFLPGQGLVYEVDPDAGTYRVLMDNDGKGFFWSDGVAVDNVHQKLYIGELMTGHMYTYDITADKATGRIDDGQNALLLEWLDDFAFNRDCASMVGADWNKGHIVEMWPGRNTSSVLYKGFKHPTAVMWGRGPGFRETSLYVTQGGSFSPSDTDYGIQEIPNARPPPPAPTADTCLNS